MKRFARHAFGTGVAAALLAGCGSQIGRAAPQIAPLSSRQSPAKGTSGGLLYASGGSPEEPSLYVFSYPQGKRITKLTSAGPSGECVDAAGDVFIMSYSVSNQNSTVFEYAHGGTTPIASLGDPGAADGCSVDPASGNLAVANSVDTTNSDNGNGDVAVYAQAQGQPTMYRLSGYSTFFFPGYDDSGNLYATARTHSSGPSLVALPNGSASVEPLSLNAPLEGGRYFNPSVQWDGKYMTVSSDKSYGRDGTGDVTVYRFTVSGSNATVVARTTLTAAVNRHRGQSWITGNTIIGMNYNKGWGYVCYWRYPKGGSPRFCTHRIQQTPAGYYLLGVTVSPAQ